MKKLFLRLDDACPKRNINNWNRIENLLDKYNVKPLVGIIPACKDPDMEKYPIDEKFWDVQVQSWKLKNWTFAMHGFNHVFGSMCCGINPVDNYSEFAGLSFEVQCQKIRGGVNILRKYGIEPLVFFAPAHTFDLNTIKALKQESKIRIISDVPANKPFFKYEMTFVPQQSGQVRELLFDTTTFCYHPNNMNDSDFEELEIFLKKHKFSPFPLEEVKRRLSVFDYFLMKLYYWKHRK